MPVAILRQRSSIQNQRHVTKTSTTLNAAVPDLDVIALVAGQENYGFALAVIGEAVWSFLKAPSVDHGVKTIGPAGVAAIILAVVSGPMITSGDASSVATGLGIATAVSLGIGASYVARLASPFSPSPKEIAALGLLVSLGGFWSFSQNLVVDGFVALPSIELPSIDLPSIDLPFGDPPQESSEMIGIDASPMPSADLPSASQDGSEIVGVVEAMD